MTTRTVARAVVGGWSGTICYALSAAALAVSVWQDLPLNAVLFVELLIVAPVAAITVVACYFLTERRAGRVERR